MMRLVFTFLLYQFLKNLCAYHQWSQGILKFFFGEYVTLRLVRTQNRELSFRCIAYNTDRLTNLTIIIDGFYKAYLLSLFIYDQCNPFTK